MTKIKALQLLETMPDKEFNEFFNQVPMRTQLLIRGHFVDWRETLPQWYIKLKEEK